MNVFLFETSAVNFASTSVYNEKKSGSCVHAFLMQFQENVFSTRFCIDGIQTRKHKIRNFWFGI